ncbi:MAG: D-tyrosyl-tRNA(Tyr) deacylase [Victivallales bacterium]|nr:D-tyrosyl-tRNA(Tyr) deacylase [Victivallales bacterium]
MRALVQRVSSAFVVADSASAGEIGRGLLILLGVSFDDTEAECNFVAEKCLNLRIFEDVNGKMNLSALDVRGEILVVSQFTLYGDCSRGRRPDFTKAAPPEQARKLYDMFICEMRKSGLTTRTGVFGAMMQVSLCNSGPVTLLVESRTK